MCGIAGFVPAPRRRLGVEELRRVGDRMAASLAHRGPDGNGVWVADESALVLAHRRLAVVGLGRSGTQPMRARSGRHVIPYNGELYNALAIGRRLEDAGEVFRGTSDAEVLLEAIDRWGTHDALVAADVRPGRVGRAGPFPHAGARSDGREVTRLRDRRRRCRVHVRTAGVAGGAWFPGATRSVGYGRYLRCACVPVPSTVYAVLRKLPPARCCGSMPASRARWWGRSRTGRGSPSGRPAPDRRSPTTSRCSTSWTAWPPRRCAAGCAQTYRSGSSFRGHRLIAAEQVGHRLNGVGTVLEHLTVGEHDRADRVELGEHP